MAAPLGYFKVTDNVDVIAADHMNSAIMQGQPYFGSAAARDSAWPTPHDGAICWLTDSHTPWRYRGGAWHAAPLGFLASAVGPASQQDVSAAATLASLSVQVVTGRNYRAYGWVNAGSQITAVGGIVREFIDIDAGAIFSNFCYATNLATGASLLGAGHYVYTAVTTKSVTFAVKALASTGGIRIPANSAGISVDDIGS